MNIRNETCVLDTQKYAYTISTFYNRYKTQFSYLTKILFERFNLRNWCIS